VIGRAPALVGGLFVAGGLLLFLWKAVGLGLPVMPTETEGPWRVELEVGVRGSTRGSVRAALPSTGPGQVIFDETHSSDGLDFNIRTEDDHRLGVWRGPLSGTHLLTYAFRVELSEELPPQLPSGEVAPPPPYALAKAYLKETPSLPVRSSDVKELVKSLALPAEPADRARLLFAFVADEVAETQHGPEDARLTLSAREGRPEGRVLLLVTLLRAAGIPARPVAGLRLASDMPPERVVWCEAWLGVDWVPLAPGADAPGQDPVRTVLLRPGGIALVEATGVEAVNHRWRALREHLRPNELAAMMVPTNPLLARLSLYRLPVETQSTLRALLLLPLGALVVALFRNLVGVPTFGTFMPVLIALALRSTSLGPGLLMVITVIGIGIAGRLALERLRLLLVPRLSVLLCLVVMAVVALALFGTGTDTRNLLGGVLLPMVILTMLIERVSVTLAEEGTRTALTQAGWSTVVAVAAYPLFTSARAEHLMFGFPELVLVVMGLLIWIGGYTGYRLTDLIRFRALAREDL
jgi:hypothetical protein